MPRFREAEIALLSAFIAPEIELTAPSVLIHGHKAVGKTYTTARYLQSINVKNSFISCDECMTRKILLQRCFSRFRDDSGVDYSQMSEIVPYKGNETHILNLCESIPGFLVALEMFKQSTGYRDHHVLVLDRFDQSMEAHADLLAGLLRMHEQAPFNDITVVVITTSEPPSEVVTHGVPMVYFRPYTQDEVTAILQDKRLAPAQNVDAQNYIEFWNQFAKMVVDLFFSYTGSDLSILQDIARKSWPQFIKPVIEGEYAATDFLKVYRDLKDVVFTDDVLTNCAIDDFSADNDLIDIEKPRLYQGSDLPVHSKFLLIASYLASFIDPKNDLHYFSKLKAIRGNLLRKNSKVKKLSLTKEDIDTRLLQPNFFELERLYAIVSVIYRNESKLLNKFNEKPQFIEDLSEREIHRRETEHAMFTLSRNIDLNSQLATLATLGYIQRTTTIDILNPRVRWRCNLPWSTIDAISNDIDFPIMNYLGT